MNIFLCGSNQLTSLDKNEIKQWLLKYGDKHHIHLLCYKSIEQEVLLYFIEHEQFASRLFIYTFPPLAMMSQTFQQAVQFLQQRGSQYHSLKQNSTAVYRSTYITYLKTILVDMDLVFCFYNGDKAISVIPVDVAAELQKEAVIYDLPGDNKTMAGRRLEESIRAM